MTPSSSLAASAALFSPDPATVRPHASSAGTGPARDPAHAATAAAASAPAWPARAARKLMRTPLSLLLAWAVIVLVLLWALAPGLFTSHDPLAGQAGLQLQAPGAAHWLGTDALRRDVYARVVYGAAPSLSGAFLAVAVGLVLGSLLGLVAGAAGGRTEDAVMRGVDVLLAVPTLLLSLSIIIILGFGTLNAGIAVGMTSVASFARLVRSEVVRVRRSEYVEAAFGSGGRFRQVLWRHVLPNSLTSVIALAALQFGWAILQMSTLGFLGYGAPPPTPEWGLLIAEGRNYIATAWWLTTVPGLVVVAVVLSANRISAAVARGRA